MATCLQHARQLLHPQPPLSLDRPVRRRAASKQSIEAVNTPQYWRALCPELHVADEAFQARCLQRFRRQGAESAGTLAALREVRCASPSPPAPVDRAREHARCVCAQRMDTDGYYTRTTEEQGWVVDLTLLRLGVIRCHPLPPSFTPHRRGDDRPPLCVRVAARVTG